MDEVDRLYVTKIYHDIEGDTYFPIIEWDEWDLVSSETGLKNRIILMIMNFRCIKENREHILFTVFYISLSDIVLMLFCSMIVLHQDLHKV